MLIDPLTVVAQIFNFLILVWLLKKFLFGRIIGAIDAREQAIAATLAQAAAREKEAQEQLATYQAKVQQFEQERASLFANAKLEAEKQYAEMLDKARAETRSLETQWREELERERSALLADLRRRVAQEVVALTRRTVRDLACQDVQECAVRAFLEKVGTLDEDARRSLSRGDLLVRTAFDLPPETKDQLRSRLREHLQTPVVLRFEQATELGLGLELRGDGWRIGWNSESYLDALDQELREALERAEEDRKVGVA
jgi:F-type H+-transporting ATPase subunit b